MIEAPHAQHDNLRARLLLLAGCALLGRVLASQPVYAQAPPAAAAPSSTKPAPQKPAAKPTSKPGTTPTPSDETKSTPSGAKGATPTPSEDAALAKGTKPPKGTKPAKGTKAKGAKGKKGGTVIDEDFLIEGKLEKPNAYYILRRSQVDFDWARLDARFSPLVLESVQDPLF